MKLIMLLSLTLLLSGSAHAFDLNTTATSKVRLSKKSAARLNGINHWLDQNLSSEDCPERAYFGIVEREERRKILGYAVVANCPDAPAPSIVLYFDRDQNFVDDQSMNLL